jgi:hypothetical protein
VSYETAIDQWEAGVTRLALAPTGERPMLERVTRALEAELRRRLGGAFTTNELVALYDAGTGWCSDIAIEAAPDDPYAWDLRIVADAAFARYLRGATDYAGGRRLD